ncbi:pentatricopeptide repeat-containing protein At1g71490-like [Chenopodium quinoa]|uniref:pentatricopeptide repeat-containing protein At1g71490-like n=1 Tax=Chenopodium quinoa TaxID=63459 RepID=UPI000B78511C|nr:pentatricopeptide repeat-containing protein At1g71490-like [Chenopodium quinoa]
MPHSPSWLSPREWFIFWIELFLPWNVKRKQNITHTGCNKLVAEIGNSRKSIKNFETVERLMFHPFLTSLKECISHGDLGKAFRAFSLIQLHVTASVAHDQILESISSLLIACSKHKLLQQGRQLHSQIICLGLDQHSLLLPKLVTFYSTFNILPEAHLIAEKSSVLDPLVWNILISAYVRNGLSNKALCTYSQMLKFGITPDEFTYPSVLKACGEQLDLGFGKEVHSSILVSNYGESICVQNALISMYGKCGDVGVARVLFDNLPNKDGYSWNSMISGYASKGMWEEAFVLFMKMRLEGVELNIITWNTIIGGCLRTGNYVRALGLVSQMRTCAVKLDAVSMASGLSACSHIGAIKAGKEMHAFTIRGGCANFLNVQNALITMYAWCQDHRHAHIIFQQMEEKDIISWNSIISGYAHYGKYEEASFLFRDMLLCGFRPNYVTVASILPLCAREANLQHGKELHCFIIKRQDFSEYLLLWNALVEMYARTSRISEAQTVFNFLTRKDIVTYTSLITGYGILGEGEVALKLFEEMNSSGIKPDLISLVAVLSACSHSGLVIKGQLLFEKMWSVYGIRPCLEHYACMVDLFGRAGLLKKAEEIIRTMPFEPSADM